MYQVWQFVRQYAFKSDLKIKWVRPEKISCIKPEKSGDNLVLPPLEPNALLPGFKNSKELETADEVVKSLFKLSNNPNFYTTKHYKLELVREVQRHPQDFGSMEAKLAKMTATIRRYQQHMDAQPRDKMIKVKLKELIDKRKKFLKYLRRWDYRRFEWILDKLDLVYKPPPTKFHWITRKESLQKLTNAYCKQVKRERLQEYHKQLQAQQIPFLEDAINKMIFVRKEQIDLEIPVTITEAQIEDAKNKLALLKKKQSEQLTVDTTANANPLN